MPEQPEYAERIIVMAEIFFRWQNVELVDKQADSLIRALYENVRVNYKDREALTALIKKMKREREEEKSDDREESR